MMQRITCNQCGSVREGEYFFNSVLTEGEGCDTCNLAQRLATVQAVNLLSAMVAHVPSFAAEVQRRVDEEGLVIGLRALTDATEEQIRACARRRGLSLNRLRDEIAAGRIPFQEVRRCHPDS
jgi:hypothetical protein